MIPPAYTRRLLPATLAVLLFLTVLPLNAIRWEAWFGHLLQTLVAPISRSAAIVSRWASPARQQTEDSQVTRQLREEKATLELQLRQTQAENDQLHKVIRELQRGHDFDPAGTVQLVYAEVIGSASDLAQGALTVRAGSKQGVTQNTVATAPGLQLLGRVTSVAERMSTIVPITSKAAGGLRAVVMIDQTSNGLVCTLSPTGDGRLAGDVEDRRGPEGMPIEPRPGQEVRLSDPDHWPRSAQLLLIGTVEKVEPSPKQPLRKVVTVKPVIENLDRVSEVVLRVPAPGDGS